MSKILTPGVIEGTTRAQPEQDRMASSNGDGNSSMGEISLGLADDESEQPLEERPQHHSVVFSERDEVEHIPVDTGHSFASGESLTAERKDVVGRMNEDDIELGHPSHGKKADKNEKRMKNHRISMVTDMATGKKGGVRYHHALVRSQRSCAPKSRNDRLKSQMKNQMKSFFHLPDALMEDKEEASDLNFAEEGSAEQQFSTHRGRFLVSSKRLPRENEKIESAARQYRLKAVRPDSRTSKFARRFGVGAGQISIYEQSDGNSFMFCGFSPNNLVMKYLHWSFRRSFTAVFLSAAFCFLSLTMLFAVAIWAIGLRYPTCIGGVDPGEANFMDAYELSWTTFSTVGYGVVYSGIATTEPDIRKCTGITIVVTLEAFVGVLFASMCGAILFAKVARIQSFAQVSFSDPMVIRYGPGVAVENRRDEHDVASDDNSVETDDPGRIPCPVLEFRINNNLHSTVGGEIIDAAVNIVASIDASQKTLTVKGQNTRRRRGKKGKKRGPIKRRRPSVPRKMEDDGDDDSRSSDSIFMNGALSKGKEMHQQIEEDPTGYLVPRRIFSKLEVESPDHPFFKRVWIVRHRLDEHSPLLKNHARQMVCRNRGFWPRQLNTYELVRDSVYFDQILVSLSGTSNADANAVYAQKAYDFGDVCVGYRFANQLYRDEADGSLSVDARLISDVTEQAGGGGEPLTDRCDNDRVSAAQMMVL